MRGPVTIFSVLMCMLATSPAVAIPDYAAINAQAEFDSTLVINDSATELAQFLYSREGMTRQLEQILSVALPQSMKTASDFGIYEAEYPGLIAAVVTSLKPAMLKAYDDKMPLLWKATSQIYRENFSPAELEQLVIFFKSPVGVRLSNSVQSNFNTQQFMDAAVASEGELTDLVVDASKKAKTQAIKKTTAQMSPADKLAIFRFENSSLGPKLALVGPTINNAILEWDYFFTDERKQEFLAIRQSAIAEFIAKADAQSQTINVMPSASENP